MINRIFLDLQTEIVLLIVSLYIIAKTHSHVLDSIKIRVYFLYTCFLGIFLIFNLLSKLPDIGLLFTNKLGGFIVNWCYMVTSAIVSYCWLGYTETVLESKMFATKLRRFLFFIPFGIFVLLCSISYNSGLMFTCAEDGTYIRGSAFLQAIGFFYIAVSFLRNIFVYVRNSKTKYVKGIIAGCFISTIGIILNLFFAHNYYTIALVIGLIVTYIELCAEETRELSVQNIVQRADEITAQAGLGLWTGEFESDKPARLYPNKKMRELLEVENYNFTPEEMYEYWISRIKPQDKDVVDEYINDLKSCKQAEVVYVWTTNDNDERYVRCGGNATYDEKTKTFKVAGYHYDTTEATLKEQEKELKLKSLLEQNVIQKQQLQNALLNYKKADIDRRIDFLTGLYNRLDLFEMIQDVLTGYREGIVAMYMLDLDDFKALNDTYGHEYGDMCLKKIGEALMDYGKENNIFFYRYGGEEILGVYFGNEKCPRKISIELVKLVSDLNIKREDNKSGCVTVSLGYTTDSSRYEKMIDKADKAMYKAKEHGKNWAICYEDLAEDEK